MKPTRNIDINGKTRPTTTAGIASPKAKGNLKEAEAIIKGDSKKAAEGVQQRRKPGLLLP